MFCPIGQKCRHGWGGRGSLRERHKAIMGHKIATYPPHKKPARKTRQHGEQEERTYPDENGRAGSYVLLLIHHLQVLYQIRGARHGSNLESHRVSYLFTFEGETLGAQASCLHRIAQDTRAPWSDAPESEQVRVSGNLAIARAQKMWYNGKRATGRGVRETTTNGRKSVAPSSSGPGHCPLKAKIAGSNPAGVTIEIFRGCGLVA